jgi:hypothetical protein
MAAVAKKLDWSEDADAIELPQITRTTDADGIITEISYRVEDGKKLRTTRRIRIVKAVEKVSHAEAQRKGWKKFGAEKGKSDGPQSDTTSVGENIKVKLTQGYSTYAAKQAESQRKTLSKSLSIRRPSSVVFVQATTTQQDVRTRRLSSHSTAAMSTRLRRSWRRWTMEQVLRARATSMCHCTCVEATGPWERR